MRGWVSLPHRGTWHRTGWVEAEREGRMGRPDRALVADAGLTVVLGVAFAASTAGSTGARELDGLGWALTADNALPMAYAVDVLQRGWWTGTWDLTALVVLAGVLVAATAVAVWRLRDA